MFKKTVPAGNSKFNISDDGNLIYSRSSYETSGEISGLKQLKNTFVDLKGKFEEDFSKFEEDINSSYTQFGNDNLIDSGVITNSELNFSNLDNNSDNSVALSMLSLRNNDSPDQRFNTEVFTRFNSSNTQYMYSESFFNTQQDNMNRISKVNLDEEMVNLLKWKRAYEANAVVIKTMDEIMKTTLSLKA